MAIRDMVARHSNFDETRDFIPTPPWATRALFEYVIPGLKFPDAPASAWDPAAGRGHMLSVFRKYGYVAQGSDILAQPDLGIEGKDFRNYPATTKADLIITNPPYALLGDFIREGLDRATKGLALLCRIQALESQTRYREVYRAVPPTDVHIFADRIPFKTGAVVRKAPKMFTHCWLYWDIPPIRDNSRMAPRLNWIPPEAQSLLEKDEDYA